MTRYLATLMTTAAVAACATAAAPSPHRTMQNADEVLEALAKLEDKSIPPKLLADAHGIAIIPKVIKAGFVLGGRGGHGLVMVKDKDGNWGDPVFVNIGGASVGLQIGVESTDVVLVFRTRKSLDRILEGKNKLTLGADAAVAAGPVGRQVAAATDGKLEAEIVSYSRSRGLFAGVSLDGAVINPDDDSQALVRKGFTPDERKSADGLKARLILMATTPPLVEVRPSGAVPLSPVRP